MVNTDNRPGGPRPSSNNTLYFIVGALVIAVLIIGWFMYGGDDADDADVNVTTEQPAAPDAGGAMTETPATPPATEAPATPPAETPATPPASETPATPPAEETTPPAEETPPAGEATPPAGEATPPAGETPPAGGTTAPQ
jgi:hypothetical protein